MNVNFEVLSTAVHQVTNASATSTAAATTATTDDGLLTATTTAMGKAPTNAVPVTPSTRRRRRSSINSGASNAKQFLELAHKSWTFAQSDLPSGEGAFQRRRSSRINTKKAAAAEMTKLTEMGHKSWPQPTKVEEEQEKEEEQETPSLFVVGSPVVASNSKPLFSLLPPRSKTEEVIKKEAPTKLLLPPRSKSHLPSRRASIASCSPSTKESPAPAAVEEEEMTLAKKEVGPSPAPAKRRGKLTRRSSLLVVNRPKSLKEAFATLDTSAQSQPAAATKQSRSPSNSPKVNRRKMVRRNTIGSCSNEEEQRETAIGNSNGNNRSPKQQSRRTSLSKKLNGSFNSSSNGNNSNNATGKAAGVRFELDHKNRIKRRVSYIRKNSSAQPNTRALWWSEEDLERIYQRENRVYDKFSNDRGYTRAVRKLWGNCSKAANVPLGPEAVARVAGAPARGLEVDILETVRDRRARVIANVLDAQETLRDFDPTIRAKVLGARYKNLCRAASRFAQKMGEGDALEAANIMVYSN